jgi:hypothetical protein
MTYTLIAHQELTSSQASITFSSIPQTFTDLLLVFSIRDASSFARSNAFIQVNSDSTVGNYTVRYLAGDGSSAFTQFDPNGMTEIPGSPATANTFGNTQYYLPNYRSSVAKSFSIDNIFEQNATTAVQKLTAGIYTPTSAVTSLRIISSLSANLVSGSSATLYGITSGSSGGVVVS